MDKSLKQIIPMLCPVCGEFYFSELTDVDIEQLGLTPNDVQCSRCGWYYDLEQLNDPDLKKQSNQMSLNEYKKWYEDKIKINPKWEYYVDFIGDPEPHMCPVCGEYLFKDFMSYDICPVCGWEDDDEFDGKGANRLTLDESILNFKKKRKDNPSYKWFDDDSKK